MAFHRENQRVTSSDLLQAIASGEEIKLDRCTISGELDLNRLFVKEEDFDTSALSIRLEGVRRTITLSMPIAMNSCTFENDVFFAPPWDRPGELSVIFQREIVFNSSRFSGQARFSGAIFNRIGSFDGCTFDRVSCFRGAHFVGRGMFRTVTFDGYGLFNGAVFEHEAFFNNTCFSKGGNFTRVFFKGRTDFAGVYSRSKSVPIYESVRFLRKSYGDDESFWRFIKQASQEAGYYQLAGESFYNERCSAFWRRFRGLGYDELPTWRKILRWISGVRLLPEFVLGRLLFGYGERPIRVLLASLSVILVCGFFYASPYAAVHGRGAQAVERLSLMDGMYFSTITFTTLGFGDLYPEGTNLLTRSMAMGEAISGACLMSLFVVCLSKRYSRG
ncbi:MAG: potassium channel family protein [Sedimentisphaerales bacterium]|nr:potassium channel family protein [Sedimentisphaerales bacterium]